MAIDDPIELKRALDAFDRALDLAENEREAWLSALSATDAPLAARVQALLAAHAQARAQGFMHEPVQLPAPVGVDGDSGAAVGAGALEPGAMLGPYRLVREIGAGGMGVVWLAERADGLFKRPVALKLPHLGPNAKAFVERFAREREILAALDHPNIARLYDAGVSAQGQPYLAIEYVEGERLDTWCDRQRLGPGERVRLFIDVLHAVQYAHGRLVVHRDLKPANILVTRDAQVKLLDFGIARLLAESGSEPTALTQLGGGALTPDYASPEQIGGGAIGIASDVYSLGVVLYELLAGQRPYKLKRDTRGALEDAILAADVKRPSEAAIDADTARARGTHPARLRRQLRGDLDTIVTHALAKQPAARYTTTSAFADDLQRHLDGRPVLARSASGLHRAGKFVLRHRYAVGSAAAVLALVAGSAVLATMQAIKARQEAAVAEATRNFVVGVFEHNSSSQPNAEKARATTARQLLDLGRDQLLHGPTTEPVVKQAMMATLSEMYFQLGLGTDALALDRARLALNRETFGDLDPRTLDAQKNVAQSLLQEGTNDDELFALAKDTIAKLDRIGDRESLLRGQAEGLLAETLNQRLDPAGFVHQQRAVELMSRRHSGDREFPVLLGNFARTQLARGDLAGAKGSALQALEAWNRLPVRDKHIGAYLQGIAAQTHEANDALGAAESAFRTGMRMEHEVYEADSWLRHGQWVRLSRLLVRTGRAADALAGHADVLRRLAAAPDTPPWFHARALASALAAAVELGDTRAMDEMAASLQQVGCKHDPSTETVCVQALLESQRARGDLNGARELLLGFEAHTHAMLRQAAVPAGIPIDALISIAHTHLALGAVPQATQSAETARQRLGSLAIQPIVLDLRLGLVERDILRAKADVAAARALSERLQRRIAAHPDRVLLSAYEQALGT